MSGGDEPRFLAAVMLDWGLGDAAGGSTLCTSLLTAEAASEALDSVFFGVAEC